MNKKNIATTIILILCSVLFAVTGSTFMNLLYQKNKIVVKDPVVIVSDGVLVSAQDDENDTQIAYLKFSDMNLGLKPVTGKVDQQTNIPSTVTDKNGTEGLYSAIKITAPVGLSIKLTNIKIESDQEYEKLEIERKNMWIALKDVKNSANNLQQNEVVLYTSQNQLDQTEFVVLFWLDSNVGKTLKGAKISFEMHFVL